MAGRGVGAAERSRAVPQPGPRPRASRAARSGLGGPCCPLHPALGRSPLSSPRSPAGRAGAPETPSGGSRLVVGGWSGPGGDLLAMSSAGDTSSRFRLHLLFWNNYYRQLEKELWSQNAEALDPRGGTLLHLAVSLGHLESTRVLLRHKADMTKENGQGWTVLHEAVSTEDPEMVYTVLKHRDYHNTAMALEGVPELLHKILEAPDFYMQLKWEFTSWVPLVSRICPNDGCVSRLEEQGQAVHGHHLAGV